MNILKQMMCNIYTFFYYILFMFQHKQNGEWKDVYHILNKSDKKVTKLMKAAYKVPFYRKKFDECGLKPTDFKSRKDLCNFPITTKMELREWMNSEIALRKNHWVFVSATSGLSGMPLKMIYSIREKAYANANWMRILAIHGYNPFFDTTMAIKNTEKSALIKNDSFIQSLGILKRYRYSAMEDLTTLIERLNLNKPVLLYANKSVLVRMALFAKKNNIFLYSPKLICSTSEILDESSRKLIENAFNSIVFQSYGSEETAAFTYTFGQNPEKHYITHDTHCFLIKKGSGLDLTGNGDIVVTNFLKTKYPIVNYELGDFVNSFIEDEVPFISKVCGRQTDWFYFKDGSQLGFQPYYYVAEICPYCYQMRFIQENYELIRIQLVKNNIDVSVTEAEAWIISKLNQVTKTCVTYTFEWLDVIPMDANMKIKFMVCNIQ